MDKSALLINAKKKNVTAITAITTAHPYFSCIDHVLVYAVLICLLHRNWVDDSHPEGAAL